MRAISPLSAAQASKSRYRTFANLCFFTYLIFQTAATYLPRSFQLPLALFDGALFAVFSTLTAVLVVRRMDEFQRILLNRAFVLATFLTMSLAAIWGHLDLSEKVHAPHLPLLVLPVCLIVLTTIAKVFIFRRHGSAADSWA